MSRIVLPPPPLCLSVSRALSHPPSLSLLPPVPNYLSLYIYISVCLPPISLTPLPSLLLQYQIIIYLSIYLCVYLPHLSLTPVPLSKWHVAKYVACLYASVLIRLKLYHSLSVYLSGWLSVSLSSILLTRCWQLLKSIIGSRQRQTPYNIRGNDCKSSCFDFGIFTCSVQQFSCYCYYKEGAAGSEQILLNGCVCHSCLMFGQKITVYSLSLPLPPLFVLTVQLVSLSLFTHCTNSDFTSVCLSLFFFT